MVKLKCVSSEDELWFTVGMLYEAVMTPDYDEVYDNSGALYYVEPCSGGWVVCGYDVTFVEVDDGE